MFGYIKPFKPELKMREYDCYKAVYCGLCRRLGKSYGIFARLTLSYDFTFLCMVADGVGEEHAAISTRRCCVNPFKRVPMCDAGEAQALSADVAVLMLYYKLLDNIEDSGFVKGLAWRILRPLAKGAWKKASAARPEADRAIAKAMAEQKEVEKDRSPSVDRACEPSATAMGTICRELAGEESQRRVLERFGYLIGRFVYLCDALDDLEDDLKSGNYNPFVEKHRLRETGDVEARKSALEEAKGSLFLTAGETGRTAALLELKRYRPIIDNVVMMGLRCSVDEILAKKEREK